MYSLTLQVKQHGKLLEQCLATEVMKWDRSSCTITRKGESIAVEIQAKDVTALKATALTMIQLLSVFETMLKAHHD